MSRFVAEPITNDPKLDYAAGFSSTKPGQSLNLVDEFYREHAWRHHQMSSVRTYRFVDTLGSDTVGFFSLSCRSILSEDAGALAAVKEAAVRFEFIFETEEKTWGIFPSIYINYLCIDRRFQGVIIPGTDRKYSTEFFRTLFKTIYRISGDIGALYIELDALDGGVAKLYERLGFRLSVYGDMQPGQVISYEDINRLPKYTLPIAQLWNKNDGNGNVQALRAT